MLFEDLLSKMDMLSGAGKTNDQRFRIMRIISPSKFYVVKDHPDLNWVQHMQNLYQKLTTDQYNEFRIKGNRVYKYYWYVWKDKNNWWHRVEVVGFSGKMIKVRLVDFNEFATISITEMMQIDTQFNKRDALKGFCADLIDIEPPEDAKVWSEKAIETFRKNCPFRKTFCGAIVCQKGHKYRLILSEKSYNPHFQFSIQWILVKMGLADCSSFLAGHHDLAHAVTGTPAYDQEEMQKSLTAKELDSFLITKIPQKLIKQENEEALGHGSQSNLDDTNKKSAAGSRLLEEKNVAWITITAVAPGGPATFYIQMKQDFPLLEQMMTDLEKIVSGQDILSIERVQAGEIVAAKVTVFQNTVTYWTRAIIKSAQMTNDNDNDDDVAVDVILIDFGIEINGVPMSNLRELPNYFFSVAPFCQRAHMGVSIGASFRTSGQLMNGWTEEYVKSFKLYFEHWQFRDPSWYAWQPKGSRAVELQQFNQDLWYEKGRWYPTMPQMNSPYAAINRKQEDPLFRQFFTSIGLDGVKMTKWNLPYHFEPILNSIKNKKDL